MKNRNLLSLVVIVFICLGVGFLGSLSTAPNIDTWYAGLTKPPLNPPNWIFAPVWTTLYVLMAVAAWRIWRLRKDSPHAGIALGLFAVQLCLNAAWSPVFFAAHQINLAFFILLAMIWTVGWTILTFGRIDRTAALLMQPYFIWICFASYLNAGICWLNR